MKNIKFVIVSILCTASLFIGCQNPSNDSTSEIATGGSEEKTPTKYVLSFDFNVPQDTDDYYWDCKYGFEQTPKSQTAYSGEKLVLPSIMRAYFKTSKTTGYIIDYDSSDESAWLWTFIHWNTKSDGTGTSYNAGDSITLTEDLMLYAIYRNPNGSDTDNKDTNILDMYKTTEFSMKVGQSVTLKPSWIAKDNCYYTITSNDYKAIEISGKILTAKAIGTAIVKMTSNINAACAGYCTISVTAEGFEGTPLENLLIGRWVYKDSSSSGTIVLNADKTGHITAYLGSTAMHDTSFNWSAKEEKSGSTKRHYLKIENASGSLDGYHTLEDVRSNRFTLDEYLAFGMPKTTTWYKK